MATAMIDQGNPIMGDDELAHSRTPLLKAVPTQRAVSVRQGISGLLADWWLWEIISAATCILALTVIVVILLVYDSSALPDWPSVFTVWPHLPTS